MSFVIHIPRPSALALVGLLAIAGSCLFDAPPGGPSHQECVEAHEHILDLRLRAALRQSSSPEETAAIESHRSVLDSALRDTFLSHCREKSATAVHCLRNAKDLAGIRTCDAR